MYNKKPLKEMTVEERKEYNRECRRRHQLKKINGEEINKYNKFSGNKKIKEMTPDEKREYNREANKRFNKAHPERKWDPVWGQKRRQRDREKAIAEGRRKDLNKSDIPIYERCEGFDELWDMVYMQVLSYWDEIPTRTSKYNVDKPTKIKR